MWQSVKKHITTENAYISFAVLHLIIAVLIGVDLIELQPKTVSVMAISAYGLACVAYVMGCRK